MTRFRALDGLARILVIAVLAGLAQMDAAEPTWWTDHGAQELSPSATQPANAGRTLSLLAPANGVASGQLAIRGEAPIDRLSVSVGDLTGPAGTLPGSCVRVRFLAASTQAADALLTTIVPAFQAGGNLAVAYLTAEIPSGTAAGSYEGRIAIDSSAGAVAVPCTITVADLVMPGRKDLEQWISLMQSPAQLALAYKTKPYGPEHWAAIETSTRLLGDLGHHVLFVPALWHANCGSGPQMITFRRSGTGLSADLSRLERYFRLVARECGPQRLLVLGVWGRWLADSGEAGKTLHLTSEDEAGNLAPLAWSADYAAHEALWKAVYDGVADLAGRILAVPPERIVLGYADDTHPSNEVDTVWQRIAPRSPGWDAWTHNYSSNKGPRPVFFQIVDTATPGKVDALLAWPPRSEAWTDDKGKRQPFYISSCRDVQHSGSPAVLYYALPDLAAAPQKTGQSIGFCRIGLDFWEKDLLLVDGRTVRGDGYARDGEDTRTDPDRVIRNYRGMLTAQGPAGALPLVHFEALREGVQVAQARILLAREAAADPARKAEIAAVLQLQWENGARFRAVRQVRDPAALRDVTPAVIRAGWEPLFTAAGAAQRRLGLREAALASAVAETARRAAR